MKAPGPVKETVVRSTTETYHRAPSGASPKHGQPRLPWPPPETGRIAICGSPSAFYSIGYGLVRDAGDRRPWVYLGPERRLNGKAWPEFFAPIEPISIFRGLSESHADVKRIFSRVVAELHAAPRRDNNRRRADVDTAPQALL